MDLGLKDKVALVVGATSGLGLATAEQLSAEGARVVVCGRDIARAERAAATLPGGIAVALDLSDEASIASGVDAAVQRLGAVDVLVLGGGGPPPSRALGLEAETSRAAAVLLVHGAISFVTRCLPAMQERGWGRIVAIGSSAVRQPIATLATSSMFRAALASYLKLLSEEVAASGVTVNMVHPGRIATTRVHRLDETRANNEGISEGDVRRQSEGAIPVGRYGDPAEFAAVVTFLCSQQASYVTGEQLRVDGGLVRAL